MTAVMHITHFFVAIIMVASLVVSSATAADEPALDSIKYYPDDPGVAVPPKDEPTGPETPPNCEWVVIEGEMVVAVYLECHLPPECVLMTIGEEGGPQFVFIECDIPPHCQLNSGTTEGGVTYWYIACLEVSNESACEQIREQMDSGALPLPHVWAWYMDNCVEPEFDTIVHSPARANSRNDMQFVPAEPPSLDDAQFIPAEPPVRGEFHPVEPPSRDFRPLPNSPYTCEELEYAINNGLLVSEDAWNWYHRNCVDRDAETFDCREIGYAINNGLLVSEDAWNWYQRNCVDNRDPVSGDDAPGAKPGSAGRPADKPVPTPEPEPKDPPSNKPAPEREPQEPKGDAEPSREREQEQREEREEPQREPAGGSR